MSILDQLQAKDKQKKSQISVMIAGGITGVIALIWITTLPARLGERISLSDPSVEGEQSSESTEKKGIGSFLSDTKSQLGSIFQSNREAIQETKQALEETSSFDELSPQEQQAPTTESVPNDTLTSGEVSATSSVPSSPTPPADVSQPSTTAPVPASADVEAPRVILIGTTTSHSPE